MSRSRYRLFLDEHVASDVFLAAFILTRPLGAMLNDFLDKPVIMEGWH
jgi:uncharacterized membrane-anchored protein